MTAELTPAEILARARFVYATCTSYRDTGVVATRYVPLEPGDHRHASRQPFWTDFIRPDRFRFEWADATVGPEDEWKRRYILWNEEGVRFSCMSEVCECDSVLRAISAATGVSGGSAYIVPTLMIPGMIPGGEGRDPLAAEGAVLRGRERLGERECFVLEFVSHEGRKEILWIGCDDFLIRRLDEQQLFDARVLADLDRQIEDRMKPAPSAGRRSAAAEPFDRSASRPFRTEKITSYEPVVNALIEPERFTAPAEWLHKDTVVVAKPREPIPAAPAPSGSPSAAEVLARVRRVYGSCATLRDRGTCTRINVPRGPLGTKKETFEFLFARPDRFRFESAEVTVGPEEDWERRLCLWNAEGIGWRGRRMPGGKRDVASGAELLGGFWLSFAVPALLVPGSTEQEPVLAQPTLLGVATHEGIPCSLVRGTCVNGTERTLWIDSERAWIRRCVDVHEFDAAWREKMRLQAEERLRMATDAQQRKAIEFSLEHFSKPWDPYRTESTLLFHPELDPFIPAELFATPASWHDP